MKQRPHLSAAFASMFCLLAALVGFTYYAQALEQKYISALAPLNLPEAINGIALQLVALDQPDLLIVFGSSEVTFVDTSNEASQFFRNYPTGFAVMAVARLGASALTMAQDLAALGPSLRGKKVVISLSPGTFIKTGLQENFYAGNYSRLHAYEMVFSPYLSLGLKHAATKIMLKYAQVHKNDPFLKLALGSLGDESIQGRLLYYLIWPLGKLQIEIMRLQDHAEVVAYLQSHKIQPTVPHTPQQIDWAQILEAARLHQELTTSNNPYGVDETIWSFYQRKLSSDPHTGSGDLIFIQKLSKDREWPNLRILLNVLEELGAQPLILSRPMNIQLWEAMGVSEKAQSLYYAKLHEIVNPYQFPIVDFQSYGRDVYFSIDSYSHTSSEGWVHVDRVLDTFFHGGMH